MRVFALTCALAFGQAATAEDIGAAVKSCRAEPDDSRRLACYDRAVDGARPTAPTAAAPAPKPEAPKTAASAAAPAAATAAAADDKFGRERALESEEANRKKEEVRSLGTLESIVSGIATREDGLMTITLANGQVWRQNAPDSQVQAQERRPGAHPARRHEFIHPVGTVQAIDAGDAGQVNGCARARLLEMRCAARRSDPARRPRRLLPRLPRGGPRLPDVPVLRPVEGKAVRRAGRRPGPQQGAGEFLRLLRAGIRPFPGG